MKPLVTLTVAEIIDLADFAGLTVSTLSLPDIDMDTEISIGDCPPDGVHDDEDSTGPGQQFRHVAWVTEYREEGVCPLGPELEP